MRKWLTKKWTILGILASIWLLFTIGYSLFYVAPGQDTSRSFEIIKFAFLSISTFGVLFSVLLASFNSLDATANIQDRISFDRTENSFHYLHRWDLAPLMICRDLTRRVRAKKDELSPQQLREEINTDENLHRSVIAMFNFFEELKLSIDSGRVDEGILEIAFADVFVDIYDRFRPWLDEMDAPRFKQNLLALRRYWG